MKMSNNKSFRNSMAGQAAGARRDAEHLFKDLNRIFAFTSISIIDLPPEARAKAKNNHYLFEVVVGIAGAHLSLDLSAFPQQTAEDNRAMFVMLSSAITTQAATRVMELPHYRQ